MYYSPEFEELLCELRQLAIAGSLTVSVSDTSILFEWHAEEALTSGSVTHSCEGPAKTPYNG